MSNAATDAMFAAAAYKNHKQSEADALAYLARPGLTDFQRSVARDILEAAREGKERARRAYNTYRPIR